MRIGVFVDLRFTALKAPTGVTKHIVEMVQGLSLFQDVEIVILACKDQLDKTGKIPSNNSLSHLPVRKLPYSWHFSYFLWLFFGRPFMDKFTDDLDWVYCPKNDFIPVKKTKSAFTFHGAHEIDPNYSHNKSVKGKITCLLSKILYRRMIKQGNIILTVSQFLKDQIIAWFGTDANKIKIVGNGVEDVFYKKSAASLFSDKKPFLLSVGGFNYLDGGDRIIKVAAKLKDDFPEINIVMAGNQHDRQLEEKAKQQPNIIFGGYLKAKDLAAAMQEAEAMLFLTRYETFGIAAAEALASGLPVIATPCTAVPEIIGKEGLYVTNSYEVEVIEKLETILQDDNYRKKIITRGVKKAKTFRWSSCVYRLYTALHD